MNVRYIQKRLYQNPMSERERQAFLVLHTFRSPLNLVFNPQKAVGVISILLLVPVSSPSFSKKQDCLCPASSREWVLYPDSASLMPDFFNNDKVNVRKLLVCRHGINFFFNTQQWGHDIPACLVIAKPTFDEILDSVPSDSSLDEGALAEIERDLDYKIHRYELLYADIQRVLGRSIKQDVPCSFTSGWFKQTPQLHFSEGLTLQYLSERIQLGGFIDVYFHN